MKLALLLGTTGFAVVGLGIAEASLALVAQAAPGADAAIRAWWPIILTAGGGLMGYARLTERQKTYETVQTDHKKAMQDLTAKVDKAVEQLARIEGRLSTEG